MISACTICPTSSAKLVLQRQPGFSRAFAGIAEQEGHFRRPQIARIDRHQHIAGLGLDTLCIGAVAAPFDPAADFGEGELHELARTMRFTGREHLIVARGLPHDEPHAFDIVSPMAPIALCVEIAEMEPALQAWLDRGHGARDLACDEGFTAQGTCSL